MKRAFKWLGRSILGLLVLTLLLLTAIGLLVGTDRGFAWVTAQAQQRVAGLELEGVAGNLLRGIQAERFAFQNDSIAIEGRDLTSGWRMACLLERRFCLDEVIVDELFVETFETDAPPPPEPTGETLSLPDIALPIDVAISDVQIGTFRFQAPGEAPEQRVDNIALSLHTVQAQDGTQEGAQGGTQGATQGATQGGTQADSGVSTEGGTQDHRTEGTRGSVVMLDNLSADYEQFSLATAGNVTLQGDYPIDLSVQLTGTDILDDHDAAVDVSLNGSLADLTVSADISGAVEARLDGQLQPLNPDLPVSLTLSAQTLGWPLDTREIVEVTQPLLSIDGTLDDFLIGLDASLSGAQVPESRVTLRGRANPQRVNLPILEIETLGGQIDANAYVALGENLQWHSTVDFADIQPERQFPDITGNLAGTLVAAGELFGEKFSVALEKAHIEGTLRDYPLMLDARVSKGLDDTVYVENLRLENGPNSLSGEGAISDRWQLVLNADMPELQTLLPQLAGGFSADVDVSGALEEPSVSMQARSAVVKFNDVLVQNLMLDADISRLALDDSSLTLRVEQVKAADQEIDNIALDFAGQRGDHTLALFADGPEATSIDLNLRGALDDAFSWDGVLEAVELELPAHLLNLESATSLAWDAEAALFTVDAHCWITGDTRLCLENPVTAAPQGQAVVSLDQYSLERLEVFLPAETTLQGILGINSTLYWGEQQPGGFRAEVALAIDDGGATVFDEDGNPVTFEYRSLTVDAEVDPTSIDTKLALASERLGQADIQFTLDPASEVKSIDGRVDLTGLDISFAQAFAPQFDTIEGVINANGDLSGSLSDPRFEGEIVLSGLAAAAEIMPLTVESGEISTFVRGRRAFIEGELTTNNEGSIVIDGSANWQQLEQWRFDMSITGDDLDIRQEPLVESEIDPDIQISVRPGRVQVGGSIDIPMARIDVADLPEGATSLSEDVIIIEDIEEQPENVEEVAADAPFDINVGIDITLGDDVDVSAYGLEAALRGDMSVGLRSPNPVQLGGEIQVYDGVYRQYGQNLQATGQILFVGPVDQSRLDIKAIREIDAEERIAGLHIQGTVATPEISLFTEPADKSEEAILSYIVLGRDIGDASDQEANLLASAAIALSARGGRAVGSNIADKLGIEEFALETRGSGNDTEVVVSGRLNERLLLRYGQSVFDPQGSLYLRYDITKKLYLEAAEGLESAVDLFYSFSF